MQQDRELRDLARAIAAFRKRGDARYPAKRLEVFGKVSPLTNRLYCYFHSGRRVEG